MRQKEELMRFVVKIDKCWLLIGGHYNHGYGKFWNGDRYEGAHRGACPNTYINVGNTNTAYRNVSRY